MGVRALGTLAARGKEARRLVAEMYLNADREETLRGGYPLAFTIDYIPRIVGRLVRFALALGDTEDRDGETHRKLAPPPGRCPPPSMAPYP